MRGGRGEHLRARWRLNEERCDISAQCDFGTKLTANDGRRVGAAGQQAGVTHLNMASKASLKNSMKVPRDTCATWGEERRL